MVSKIYVYILFAAVLLHVLVPAAAKADEPALVTIRSVDRTIAVELRYATARNIARRPIYPPNMPALVRPHVAAKLAKAQAILREAGYGLKIWDAYRPAKAHEELWRLAPQTDYLADPAVGGSLHTCGVAVDATLVDKKGREVAMPTDFDEFTQAAMLRYEGDDKEVRRNLRRLQNAMARAGFYGLRTEWWHFVVRDWEGYEPIADITLVPQGQPTATPVRASSAAVTPPPLLSPAPLRIPGRSFAPPNAGRPGVRAR